MGNVKIRNMEDLPANDSKLNNVLFTDGVGYMSSDVAELIPINVFKGIEKEDVRIGDNGRVEEDQQAQNSQNYASLIQTRIFQNGSVYKGTLQVLDSLPEKTLFLYNSMRKIRRKEDFAGQSITSFELVSASRDLQRTGKLSQDLILLLSIGGVSKKLFIDAVHDFVRKVELVFKDRKEAFYAIGDWDESKLGRKTLHMLAAGISLDEPDLLKNLLDLTRNRLEYVSKGRVPLSDTFYIMGTADPTGTLKSNEVAIFRGKTAVCGTVLVYRGPGKHPGDIHKLEAVYSFPLMKVAGQSNQAIFFPTQGARPLPHQIGKGDLDGDLYWVCTNTEVVNSFREWDSRWYPGDVNSKPKTALKALFQLSVDELEDAMFDDYLNKQLHRDNTVGIASTRWLTHADTYVHPNSTEADKELHLQELLKYPDYIYEAVDNKSGLQLDLPEEHVRIRGPKPLYLLKDPAASKISNAKDTNSRKSVLGTIYDIVQGAKARWQDPTYRPGDFKRDPAFYVQGFDQYRMKWLTKLGEYNSEIFRALKEKGTENYDPEVTEDIKLKYKMELYGAPTLNESPKQQHQILQEASAIYTVVYAKAETDVDLEKKPTVAFAWEVAGEALIEIFLQGKPGIKWSLGAFNEIHKRRCR